MSPTPLLKTVSALGEGGEEFNPGATVAVIGKQDKSIHFGMRI